MAKYRQVHVEFWQDGFVLDLTPEEKYFYIYLMTNSKTSQCGIYELPKRIIETETGYNRETVDKLLARFIDYGKILVNEATREIMLVNWLKYNTTKSPKVIACIKKELLTVKTKAFRDVAFTFLQEQGYEDGALYRMANKSEIPRVLAARIFERDGKKCKRCDSTEDLTIDHIFPRAMGGSNAETNLRVLCRSCNSKRATAGQGFLDDLAMDGLSLDDFDTLSNLSDTLSVFKGEEQEEEQEEEEEQKREEEKEQQEEIATAEVNPFDFFQQNFGVLSPYIGEEIGHWVDTLNSELVIEAMKKALLSQKPWIYAVGILKDWLKRNIRTIKDVQAADLAYERQKQNRTGKVNKKPIRTEKLPEWFDETNPKPKQEQPPEDTEQKLNALEEKLKMFSKEKITQ